MRRSHVRLGVRLARRELRRRPWRTALVLLMVLLPSAAMTLVVVTMRTGEWNAEDEHRAQYGRADGAAYLDNGGAVSQEALDQLTAALPEGTRLQVSHIIYDRIRTADRRTYVQVTDTRLDDPMNEGRWGSVRGGLPGSADEVVLTTDLAEALDASIGDRFRLDRLGREVRVVGTVRPNMSSDLAFVGAPIDRGPESGANILFDVPGTLDAELVTETMQAASWQTEWLRPSRDEAGSPVFWAYVGGGVGLIVLGTVITAAFAVGARRQLRSIGLLSASGAAPVTVKWFLVAQGAVAGAIGSLGGVLLTLVGVRLAPHDIVEEIAERPIAGPVVRLTDLIPIVALGTVVAAGAAWLPARSAARVPTLQALAGRRPLPRVPRRLPVLGAGAVAAGCALLAIAVAGSREPESSALWALVAVVGGLGVVMGAVAIGPWVVAGLERAGRGLRPGGRLASRSLARNRVRSSAVIGAICAVAIVVVAGSTLYASAAAGERDDLPYLRENQIVIDSSEPVAGESVGRAAPEIEKRVTDVVSGAKVVPIQVPLLPLPTEAGVPSHEIAVSLVPDLGPDGLELRGAAVATDALLDHLEVPDSLRIALDRGEVVAPVEVQGRVKAVRIDRPVFGSDPASGRVLPFGGWFTSPHASSSTAYLLIGEAGLERAGLGTERASTTLVVLPDHLTGAQRDQLELFRDDLNWEQETDQVGPAARYVDLGLPDRPPVLSEGQIKALLLAAAALVVLAVVAVGLALAAQDEAEERQILEAVGAPPRTVRRATATKAALLAVIAGAIAVPAGLLPAAAIVAAADDETGRVWDLTPDVPSLLLVLVVVPLLAGSVTWIGGRLRSAIRPKRPDVFAFGE